MTKVSVIYLTYRPGGFDLLLEGLRWQSHKDWELIVIDDYKTRDIRKLDEQVPLRFYGKSKQHGYSCPYNKANAMNTGLLQATGDIVVFLDDFVRLRPDGLERFARRVDEKTAVSGIGLIFKPAVSGVMQSAPHDDFNTGFHLDSASEPPILFAPEVFETFYWGISMDNMVKMNGVDERADTHHHHVYNSLLRMFELNGIKPVVDWFNIVEMVDHKAWGNDQRWRLAQRDIGYQANWEKRAPNKFNLADHARSYNPAHHI